MKLKYLRPIWALSAIMAGANTIGAIFGDGTAATAPNALAWSSACAGWTIAFILSCGWGVE
jgi:hypothetical protein